ncbi:MAG: hypothetical protein U5J99_00820 [Parvularculaceae bacterium]|nr:hypothetical protein [Parvularculaceae bacterium]
MEGSKKLVLGASAVIMLLSEAAMAQQSKPCSDPVFDDFDFWVGEWDVTGADGKFAGTNSITKEEYGCLLVERWTNASGITGQSYNFVDLVTGQWRQVWVSAGATIDYSGGLNEDGAMALEGVIGYPAGTAGSGAQFRGTWTPNKNGTVKQHFQQYDPSKDEWTDWFVGTYKRRETPKP